MNRADSNVYDNLIIPQASKDFLKRMENILEVNLYLSQNRFCYEKPTDADKKASRKDSSEENQKKYGSLLAVGISKRGIDYTDIYENEAAELMERLNRRNKKIAGMFVCSKFYKLEPYDKMIIGEGGGVYHDIQPLRLHPLYGVPYIPASVMKGTLRSVWMMERYGGDEKRAENDDDFILLFGGIRKDGKRMEGKLSFFDIYPERFKIGLDVQTIHYNSYYNSNRQPTDDQSTVPVLFVCLRKAAFPVFIACNDEHVWNQWKKEIDSMVKYMFTQYGIGAKTALGYGIGSLQQK